MKYFNENMSCDGAVLRLYDLLERKPESEKSAIREEYKKIMPILRRKQFEKYDGYLT